MEKTADSSSPPESGARPADRKPSGRKYRPDCLMLGVGFIFFGVFLALIFGLGAWREWDAPSGYQHNSSQTSQKRFLPEPIGDGDPYPQYRGRLGGPEVSGLWYYWKNKPDDVTVWTRVFVWVCYTLHQISIWIITYLAQVNRMQNRAPKKGVNLNKYNWISFGLNIFFHLLHLLNTHTTYDGLAQDTMVVSSQCSVIMLTLFIFLLEYNERGLFFGWPVARYHKGKVSQKLILNMGPTYLARKYHGYAFAWGAIYTFWYHPVENTYGHALGFFHTWIILLQGSLMFTDVHWNKWWRFLLETWVTIHATLVAIQTGDPGNIAKSLWPMFFFGFLFTVCFNQIYILSFWQKIPNWVRAFPPLIFVAVAIGGYSVIPDSQGRNWIRLQEVIRIPGIYYVAFFLTWGFMYLCIVIDKKIYGAQSKVNTLARRVIHLVCSLLIFVVFIAVSIVVEYTPTGIDMFVWMLILVIFFCLGTGLLMILLQHSLPTYKVHPRTAAEGEDENGDELASSREASSLPDKQQMDQPPTVVASGDPDQTKF